MSNIKRLIKGDSVALIAPAGPIYDEKMILKSKEKIESYGYKVKLGRNINLIYDYLAGEDKYRLQDLMEAFLDEEVKAIFCIRGGYGSIRLLDKIDIKVISKNPKIFVGYSDITSLHSLISNIGFTTFHGPMFNNDLTKNPSNYDLMFRFLEGKENRLIYPLKSLRDGDLEGEIIGGNLSVICSMIGSKFIYDFTDKILFIEEINEEPYKIDRFIHQLYLSNILKRVKGIVLGDFNNCDDNANKVLSLEEVLKQLLYMTDKPIYYGLECGHGYTNNILPFNAKVQIKSNQLIINKGDVLDD